MLSEAIELSAEGGLPLYAAVGGPFNDAKGCNGSSSGSDSKMTPAAGGPVTSHLVVVVELDHQDSSSSSPRFDAGDESRTT